MKKIITILMSIFMVGCAGMQRSCSSFNAQSFGSNWMIVQYNYNGVPINCWKLHNTSVSNEEHSDGIYWVDSKSGHLVHISGWYNRIQFDNGDWETASQTLGVVNNQCTNGKYNSL